MTSWGSPTGAPSPTDPPLLGVPSPSDPPSPGPVPAPTPPGHGRGGRNEGSWVGGVVLIAIGLALLIGQVIPNGGRYIVLIVGAALLAGGIATRAYGLVVPGGIVTGVGVGILLDAAEPGRGGSGLFLLSLGLGFISIWLVASVLRLPENHPWPFIPGLILTSIGALSVAGTGYAEAVRIGWPVLLIGLGLAVVLRAFGRGSRT